MRPSFPDGREAGSDEGILILRSANTIFEGRTTDWVRRPGGEFQAHPDRFFVEFIF